MLLENQLRLFMMATGEEIDHFLSRLQSIRDQLTGMGVKVDDDVMVRTALNAVTEDWETFVQSLLGKADLLNWDNMWAILQQEEIREMTKRQYNTGSSNVKKEEEEDAALASKRQQGRKKRDLSKIKCFHYGELGHFANNCPQKKKDKEASSSKAVVADDGSNDDVAMSTHEPRKWGDLDMYNNYRVVAGSLSRPTLGSHMSYGSLKTIVGQVEKWV